MSGFSLSIFQKIVESYSIRHLQMTASKHRQISVACDFLVNVQKTFQVQTQLINSGGKGDNFSFSLNKIKYEEDGGVAFCASRKFNYTIFSINKAALLVLYQISIRSSRIKVFCRKGFCKIHRKAIVIGSLFK